MFLIRFAKGFEPRDLVRRTSLTQGCCIISCTEILLDGSGSSILEARDFEGVEAMQVAGNTSWGYVPFSIAAYLALRENGSSPVSIIYKITPSEYTSAKNPLKGIRRMISGAA